MHEDLAFRMLGAGNFPRHRTIRDFRALHLSALSDLFVQVVRLAREMGLVKLGTVTIDGTKLQANASRHKAMSYERMQQSEGPLKAQIDALLERANTTDAAEADEPELDIPAELERREVRLKAIQDARERLEKRQRDADLQRGCSEGDDRRPRNPDGQPTGGRYKREFGVPAPTAQENFTDLHDRALRPDNTGAGAAARADRHLHRQQDAARDRGERDGRDPGGEERREAAARHGCGAGEERHRRQGPRLIQRAAREFVEVVGHRVGGTLRGLGVTRGDRQGDLRV